MRFEESFKFLNLSLSWVEFFGIWDLFRFGGVRRRIVWRERVKRG